MRTGLTERVLDRGDLERVLALQDAIKAAMPRQDFLVLTGREQMDYILSDGGYGLGVFEGDQLRGAWLLYYPFEREDNLARLLGLAQGNVAHVELVMLDPALRGQGLHGRMTEKLVRHAAQDGRFTHLAATVHPENAASLHGFLKNGFTVHSTQPLYGGLPRSILMRELRRGQ